MTNLVPNNPSVQVSNQEFLEGVFGLRWGEAHVTAFPGDPAKQGQWAGRRARDHKRLEDGQLNQYFCVSQFWDTPDGRAVRREDVFRAQHVLVVDDVGPKVNAAKLRARMPPPNWRLETSPGNEQWGWILDLPELDLGRGRALAKVLVDNGLTVNGRDPGMQGVTRYVRMPVGTNGKPDYGGNFGCVMREWDPSPRALPDELVEHWGGASQLPAPGTVTAAVRGRVDPVAAAADPVLAAQNDLGWIGEILTSGWGYKCTCPCADEHTPGNDSGCGYQPGPRGGWVCHHGHCKSRPWPDFYAGLDRALTAAGLEPMRRREFEDVADDDPEVDRWVKELGRAPIRLSAREKFLSDIVFSKPDNAFYSLSRRIFIPRPSINSVYEGELGGDLGYDDGKGGRKYLPVDKWFFQQPEARVIDGISYWPGQGDVFEHEGGMLANRYRPAAVVDPGRGIATREVAPWLDLVKHVLGSEGARALVWFLDWCAGVVAQPELKPGWAVVIQGTQGIGKDMLLRPIVAGVGPRNAGSIDADMLGSGFTGYAEKRFLVVKELKQTTRGASSAHDQYTRFKWLVDPTDPTLPINPKFAPVREIRNVVAVAVTTNEMDALALDPEDRRALVYVSKAGKWPAARYLDLLDWLDGQGGAGLVCAWLRQWWVRIGQNRRAAVGGNAPRTAGREAMVSAAGGPVLSWIRTQIEQDPTPDWPDVVTAAAVVANVTRALANPASGLPRHLRAPTADQAGRWLLQLGCVRLAGGEQVRTKKMGKVRLWAIRRLTSFASLGGAALGKIIDEDQINQFVGPQVVEGEFGGGQERGAGGSEAASEAEPKTP